jgi:hypothetical protein
MKRFLTLTLAVCLVAGAAYADIDGSWTATTDDENDGRIHMNMTRGKFNNFGHTFDVASLTGLTGAQVNATAQTVVQFQIAREAGTTTFEGVFKKGNGAGQFTFKGNPAYVATLRGMGLELDLDRRGRSRTEEDELFTLAALDVSTDFIRSIRAEGYKVSLEKYVEMRIFNVTPEYIREMRALGYQNLSAEKLTETKIHKATPDYIRKMRADGFDLPLDEYIAFRIHKVTPEFIAELAKLGYRNIDADDLVAMRIHKVTPEFIRELEAAGYHHVPVDKLVQMRIQKIDANFIKRMNDVD